MFNLNDNKDLDLWHGKVIKPKKVNVVQELYKDGFPIDPLDLDAYDIRNIRYKGKEATISHTKEIPKIQVDKDKKTSRLWNCFKSS